MNTSTKIDSPKRGQPSLAAALALHITYVLVGGMAAYALVQYLSQPELTLRDLVIEHLSHVALLVILIYVALNMVLHRLVVVPLRRFREKMYLVSGGELSRMEDHSGIREIHDMAEGINLMIDRFHYEMPANSPSDLQPTAASLREIADKTSVLGLEEKIILLDAASEIEGLISQDTRNVIHANRRIHEKHS